MYLLSSAPGDQIEKRRSSGSFLGWGGKERGAGGGFTGKAEPRLGVGTFPLARADDQRWRSLDHLTSFSGSLLA